MDELTLTIDLRNLAEVKAGFAVAQARIDRLSDQNDELVRELKLVIPCLASVEAAHVRATLRKLEVEL